MNISNMLELQLIARKIKSYGQLTNILVSQKKQKIAPEF